MACAQDGNSPKTKEGRAKDWGGIRVSYNPSIAFVEARYLTDVASQDQRNVVQTGGDVPIWINEAQRLTSGGNDVYVIKISLLGLLSRRNSPPLIQLPSGPEILSSPVSAMYLI